MNCPLGWSSEAAASRCNKVPSGSHLVGTVVKVRQANHYCLGEAEPEKSCDAGWSSKAESPRCTKVPPGFHLVGTEVKECQANHYCLGEAAPEKSCDAGSLSDAGSSKCLPCEAGMYSEIEGQACKKCDAGFYRSTKDTNGIATDPKTCIDCRVGRYQPESGQASCLPCIPGSFMDTTGATRCKRCHENFKSEEPGSTKCLACDTGKRSRNGSAVCNDCQPGEAGTPCSKCDLGLYRGEDDASTSCLICQIGQSSTKGSASCTKCDLGTYGSSPGVCTTCLDKKQYQDTKGETECLSCKLGDKWISPTSQCSACDLGMYGSIPGECLDCTPGMYQDGKGLSKCIECPVDTYGTKEKSVSKAECTVCPELRGTNGVTAATSNTSCLCKGSTLYLNDSTSDGYYGGYEGQSCQPCEKGARCDFDGAKLINLTAQTGYWRSSLNSTKFADCSNGYQGLDAVQLSQTRCCPVDPMTGFSICQRNSNRTNYMDEEWSWSSDNQCQDTYRGTLCLECIEGYVRVGDECKECKGGASLSMAFIAGAGLIVPVFFGVLLNLLCEGKTEHAASKSNKIVGQLKILIGFIQILSSMKTTYNGIPWPSDFLSFTIPLTVINLDIVELFGASFCSMAVSFSYKFIVHMAMPPMLAVGILFAYLISRIIKPAKTKELIAHRKAQTFKLLIAMTLFMYPGLATRCFQLFKCSKHHGIDYYILEADPSMICYQEEHMLYVALSGVFIGLYIIGIPLMMFVLLWRNKKHLYVKKGEQPSEKHKEVAFEIGGLYTQCTFERVDLIF